MLPNSVATIGRKQADRSTGTAPQALVQTLSKSPVLVRDSGYSTGAPGWTQEARARPKGP